jgi:hypothetical protein
MRQENEGIKDTTGAFSLEQLFNNVSRQLCESRPGVGLLHGSC